MTSITRIRALPGTLASALKQQDNDYFDIFMGLHNGV